jgi:hypothetical protein
MVFNNYKALHIINDKSMLKLRTFKPAEIRTKVKAGSSSFFIIRTGTRVLLKILHKKNGKDIKDLVLLNMVMAKGFYINIILEIKLLKVKI